MDEAGNLRVGVAGLGGAAQLVLEWFDKVEGVALAAAADLRNDACRDFTATYDLPAFASVEELAQASDVDAIWVETPNHLHCRHTLAAIAGGKHVICAKPLAVTTDECRQMIEAAERAGVLLIQGHSKIFDPPVRKMREIVASGRLGRVIHVQTMLYNDWLQRPRLDEELDEARGGGLVMRQAPHLVDIATYIVGRGPRSVRAVGGAFDTHFDTIGNFSALLDFGDGVGASLILNGYGWFDSNELHWDIGAMGARRTAPRVTRDRRTSILTADEKYSSGPDDAARARRAVGDHPPFFGLTIVSCEKGVIRQSPDGIYVYTDQRSEEPVDPYMGRAAELIELRDSIREGRQAFPDGRWAMATLETCVAILRSIREKREIGLNQQSTI